MLMSLSFKKLLITRNKGRYVFEMPPLFPPISFSLASQDSLILSFIFTTFEKSRNVFHILFVLLNVIELNLIHLYLSSSGQHLYKRQKIVSFCKPKKRENRNFILQYGKVRNFLQLLCFYEYSKK